MSADPTTTREREEALRKDLAACDEANARHAARYGETPIRPCAVNVEADDLRGLLDECSSLRSQLGIARERESEIIDAIESRRIGRDIYDHWFFWRDSVPVHCDSLREAIEGDRASSLPEGESRG